MPIIRNATLADAPALAAIYAPYVEQTAISFETVAPTAEEFRARMEKLLGRYPYFVLDQDGQALGYCYAGPFGGRAAYDRSCEVTLYLLPEAQGHGYGKALYAALEDALRRMGVCNLYACIALPETPDEHLTDNSAAFHAHLGYRTVGTFRCCGYKFGRWYHMIWMEKLIGQHKEPPEPRRDYAQSEE